MLRAAKRVEIGPTMKLVEPTPCVGFWVTRAFVLYLDRDEIAMLAKLVGITATELDNARFPSADDERKFAHG
jgi:hypothetical protein